MDDDDWTSETFDRTDPRNVNTGFAIDTMHLTCKDGDLRLLRSMIDHKDKIHRLGVNWRNRRGATALMTASQYGHVNCVKYLIDRKAKVDAKRVLDGSTPIVIAAKYGQLKCVKVLLETESYPKKLIQKNTSNLIANALTKSRLLCGIKVPHDIVRCITEFLVCPGADLSITNNDGHNAVEVAARYGNWDVHRYLLENPWKGVERKSRRGSDPALQCLSLDTRWNGRIAPRAIPRSRSAMVARRFLPLGCCASASNIS